MAFETFSPVPLSRRDNAWLPKDFHTHPLSFSLSLGYKRSIVSLLSNRHCVLLDAGKITPNFSCRRDICPHNRRDPRVALPPPPLLLSPILKLLISRFNLARCRLGKKIAFDFRLLFYSGDSQGDSGQSRSGAKSKIEE